MIRMQRLLWIALLACALRPAEAGLRIGGGTITGEGGYRERTINGTVSLPWIDTESESAPLSLSRLWIDFRQTRFQIDNAPEARKREFGGGVEFFKVLAVEGHFWKQPEPDGVAALYDAHGWNGAVSLKGADLQPELKIFGGITQHEQQTRVREGIIGGQLTENFPTKTSLRISGDHHAYNEDLKSLEASGTFVGLRSRPAAAPAETLEGFTKYGLALGIEQRFGPWGRLSSDWRRAYYVIGRSSHSDSILTRATLRLARLFYVGLSYEVFAPSGAPTAHYKGLTLTFAF